MIYGAIIGDIAGSTWEFKGTKKIPEKLFAPGSEFTDDSVMTIAVADALMNNKPIADTMRAWGMKYPRPMGGYGGMFGRWLFDLSMRPYCSFGNGAAMRVSAAGWVADTLQETMTIAEQTATVTHNHPEGIKGAKVVAGAIWLARNNFSKEKIREFAEGFGYDLRDNCDKIRSYYHFDATCQGTVPQAIRAFIDSDDFEDCIKLGISLGGDADTLCAIAGGIAEAYYGIPKDIIDRCRKMLPKDILEVVDAFESMERGNNNE